MPTNEPFSLPEEVEALGPPGAVYEPNRLLLVGAVASAVVILGGLALAFFAVWSLLQPGPVAPQDLLGMRIGLGAGLGLALLGVVFAWVARRARARRVVVCPNGFFLYRPTGVMVFPWDEVAEFYRQETQVRLHGILLGTDRRYTVVTTDGRRGEVTSFFRNTAELGNLMEQEVGRRVLPRALAALAAGQTIAFGPLQLSRDGLQRKNGPLLPWEEVNYVRLESGWLQVGKVGQWSHWFRSAAGAIPNVMVFLTLVDQVRGTRPR